MTTDDRLDRAKHLAKAMFLSFSAVCSLKVAMEELDR